jgi:hypothetical protein
MCREHLVSFLRYIILNLFNAGPGIGGILFVFLAPAEYKGSSDFIYMLIPFIFSFLFAIRGKQARKKFGNITGQIS